uniref:Uncharacterized protein n=1 Tax=Paramoeba aestuarina TaxID=180227 RepID=A0A7S4KIC5_9EUKA
MKNDEYPDVVQDTPPDIELHVRVYHELACSYVVTGGEIVADCKLLIRLRPIPPDAVAQEHGANMNKNTCHVGRRVKHERLGEHKNCPRDGTICESEKYLKGFLRLGEQPWVDDA